jgi:ribonuclease HI
MMMTRDRKSAPNDKVLTAFIDGGARGNPGEAGIGVYLELSGSPWQGLYKYLGHRTNNYAEYTALLCALQYSLQKGFLRLEVYSDSQLLVRQIRGEYRVKNPGLSVLYKQALQLIQKLETFAIRHIPREQNKAADALANRAQDLRESGTEFYRS